MKELDEVEAYLRSEADFNLSWIDGRRPLASNKSKEYVAERIRVAKELNEWANAIKKVVAENQKLKKRESCCPTMQEAESRALLKSMQEIAEIIGICPFKSTPRETVEAVRILACNKPGTN